MVGPIVLVMEVTLTTACGIVMLLELTDTPLDDAYCLEE